MDLALSAELPQEQYPQSVGGAFPVKRIAPHAEIMVRRNSACPLGTRPSIQRDNFSFVTLRKHSPVYCGRRSGCVVYPSTGCCKSQTQWGGPRERTARV